MAKKVRVIEFPFIYEPTVLPFTNEYDSDCVVKEYDLVDGLCIKNEFFNLSFAFSNDGVDVHFLSSFFPAMIYYLSSSKLTFDYIFHFVYGDSFDIFIQAPHGDHHFRFII